LKVDKNIKLNTNGNGNLGNANKPKPLDRRVNVDTGTKLNTNQVIKSNPTNNVSRNVPVQSVPRNPQNVGGGAGAGKIDAGKKKLKP
jgi:hypothetical protein